MFLITYKKVNPFIRTKKLGLNFKVVLLENKINFKLAKVITFYLWAIIYMFSFDMHK